MYGVRTIGLRWMPSRARSTALLSDLWRLVGRERDAQRMDSAMPASWQHFERSVESCTRDFKAGVPLTGGFYGRHLVYLGVKLGESARC